MFGYGQVKRREGLWVSIIVSVVIRHRFQLISACWSGITPSILDSKSDIQNPGRSLLNILYKLLLWASQYDAC